MYYWHWLDGHDWWYDWSLIATTSRTINHDWSYLSSSPIVISRLHVPPIVASDCKWISCEASPFGRATSRNSLWLVELLIVRHTITNDWWCDHARMVVRSHAIGGTTMQDMSASCDRRQIADSFEHDRRLILLVWSRTIIHDHYDQWHVLSTIWQRLLHFSIVTWSQIWCDCGNRKHETSL